MLACTAAPRATTSSGFRSQCGSRWKSLSHQLAHARNPGRAADEDGFVDLGRREACVLHRLADRSHSAFDDGLDQLLELRTREFALIALASGKLDIKHGAIVGRERNLGIDHGFADCLHHFGIAPRVYAKVASDVVERKRDEQIVDVVAAEMGVAIGGNDFEDAFVQLEDGDVEGPAAKIVHRNGGSLALVEAVGQCRRGRFVHQAQDLESGDAAGIFRGLSLRVVEVRGHGNDRLGDGRGEIALGVALELAQDECGNFRRRKRLLAQLDAQHLARREIVGQTERKQFQFVANVLDAAAHQAFDAVDRVIGRFDQILARGIADDNLAIGIKGDDGRQQVGAVLARDHAGPIACHIGDQRIGSAEIDADDAGAGHKVYEGYFRRPLAISN